MLIVDFEKKKKYIVHNKYYCQRLNRDLYFILYIRCLFTIIVWKYLVSSLDFVIIRHNISTLCSGFASQTIQSRRDLRLRSTCDE